MSPFRPVGRAGGGTASMLMIDEMRVRILSVITIIVMCYQLGSSDGYTAALKTLRRVGYTATWTGSGKDLI